MVKRRTVWVCVVAMMACDVDESAVAWDVADIEARDFEDNGFRLNGFRLNGFRLNGFRLNGFRLNGDAGSADYIELQSITLPSGVVVAESWLEESDLHVETPAGAVLSGAQLVGAVLHFGLVDGPPGTYKNRKVKINAVAALGPGSDVLLYDLSLKDQAGPWQPLCTDALGNSKEAILIGGAWNPATGGRIAADPGDIVTMACRDAALGKCTEWGYHPWEHADYHQACTRAVRADYCGDGISHTIDGMTIHVLDQIGIEDALPNSTYVVEAEWGEGGATCLDPAHLRLPFTFLGCSPASCGAPFASGGLIQTGVVAL